MRSKIAVILLCLSALRVAGQQDFPDLKTPFDRVEVSGNIHLVIIPSDVQKLEVTSVQEEEALQVGNKGGVLTLKAKSEISNDEAIEGKLYFISLSGLEISKGGRVQSSDTLVLTNLELDVLSGSKTELYLHVDTLDARVNQGADIILYGVAVNQHVDAYSWGNYLAYDLESEVTHAKAATGAQVKIHATKLLEANATSKAFIGYGGDPERKKIKTSVGGEISAQNP